VTYEVTFSESGLPIATEWWVNVTTGSRESSFGTSLTFSEPNGSYSYSVATPDKTYSASGGSLLVSGSSVSMVASFAAVNYTVSFSESGLPSPTGWWVNVTGGPSTFSTTEVLSFEETNGSYAYSFSTANLNYSASGGTFVVKGAGVAKSVAFAVVGFAVSFGEIGLPTGMIWSVAFRGVSASGTANLVFWAVPNGTYAFTVGSVAGFAANRTSGTVEVRGAAVSEAVAFAASGPAKGTGNGSATFLGLPVPEGYGVLGGVLIAVSGVVAAVALLRRRGGRAAPEPASAQ
jgi:hypothetical protein